MSITASNIGTDILLALTGSICASGLGSMSLEIGSGFSILCLGWVIGPVYLKALSKTVPEWVEQRYNKESRYMFVLMMTIVFILSKMGVNVYGGALLFRTMTGFENPWPFIIIIVLITGIYTAVGGLTAVMWTDLVQIILFMATGLASVGYCLHFFDHKLGNLMAELDALNLKELRHIILPKNHPEYPWYATTIAMLTHEFYYWSTDQEMAQRVIAAHGLGDARMGCALGSILKVACFFLSVVPGWTARVFWERCRRGVPGFDQWCGPNAVGGDWDLTDGQESSRAYPLLVMRNFPAGFKGLMISGFIAALMANLSAVINSLSTIFSYDVYAQLLPKKHRDSQVRLLWAGRITVIICAAIAIIWQIGIENLTINLFTLSQAIQQHFGPSIGATLAIGMAWKRSSSLGATCGLSVGITFSVIHVAFFLSQYNTCHTQFVNAAKTEANYPTMFWRWSCMGFGWSQPMTWGITLAVNIIVTLFTPKPTPEQMACTITYQDILPVWFINLVPGLYKDKSMENQLKTGYVEGILKEAKYSQAVMDYEVETKQRNAGHHDPEQGREPSRKMKKNKFNLRDNAIFRKKDNNKDKTKGENDKNHNDVNIPQQMSADYETNQNQQRNNQQEGDIVDSNKPVFETTSIDQKYLQENQKYQANLMFWSDFVAIAALFLAFFCFIYFR